MRNKREYIRHAVVLILAVAGLIICTAPFSASSGLAYAQAAAPSWSFTRQPQHCALWLHLTLLPNGEVLAGGGCNDSDCLDTAELYDQVTGTWGLTNAPNVPRGSHTATVRANGKIAFTSDRDGNREIYVMNADGTNQVRLTNNSVVDDHPTWSPDGTKIAFVSDPLAVLPYAS